MDAIFGEGDSGDLESDITDLLVALGEAAAETDKPVCILVDEVQYLDEKAISGLVAASHRIAQKGLPVVFVCAGLPQVARLVGDARSYAERLFEFIEIGRLTESSAVDALVGPAKEKGVEYSSDAAALILGETEGYPYFIQESGKHAWNEATGNPIPEREARAGCARAIKSLDEGFLKVRIDRATNAEKEFLKAMASLGEGPYRMADVADKRGLKLTSLGPVRATLISKGFVFAPAYGQIDFTVPQFDRYIRRHFNL